MEPTPTTQPSISISSLLNNLPVQTSIIADAERQVEEAIDELVMRGALQTRNRMDIKSLLNPAGESQILMEASDKEIYLAVIDAITAHENIDVIGGDDLDDELVEPHSTRRDVLKAASTIGKYTNELNDPLAWKIEALLGSFNRQLCLQL